MELSLAQTESPFRRECWTKVVETRPDGDNWAVRVAETVFYPEGGGQPADTGWLGNSRVRDVVRDDEGRIWHVTDSEPETDGAKVVAEVDWTRRFDHMQQHTAQHVITAVADDEFEMPTTSFHLGRHSCSVDLEADEVDRATLEDLEGRVNEVVRAARRVSFQFVDPEAYRTKKVRSRGLPDHHDGPVRLVEIQGVDRNTCGGTHVSNTAQIQAIKLTGAEPAGDDVRVSYLAGRRVLDELGECHDRREALKERLSCGADEHVEAVERALTEAESATRAVRHYREEVAELLGERLAGREARVVDVHRDETDFDFLNTIARAVRETDDSKVVLVTASERGEQHDGIFLVAGPDDAIETVGPEVADRLEGRGGGPPGVYQGKAERVDRRDEVVTYLEEYFGGE